MKTISDGFDYKGKTKSSDTGLFIVAVLSSQSTIVILDKHDKT